MFLKKSGRFRWIHIIHFGGLTHLCQRDLQTDTGNLKIVNLLFVVLQDSMSFKMDLACPICVMVHSKDPEQNPIHDCNQDRVIFAFNGKVYILVIAMRDIYFVHKFLL